MEVFRQKIEDSCYQIKIDYDLASRHLFVYLEDNKKQRGLIFAIMVTNGHPCAFIDTKQSERGIICIVGGKDEIRVIPSEGVTVEDNNEEEYEFYEIQSFDGQEIGMIIFGLIALFFGIVVSLLL